MLDFNDQPPAFKLLVRTRARVTVVCTVLLNLILTINLLLLSTFSELGGIPVVKNTPITIAVVMSIATILIGVIITLVYVVWANKRLDKLTSNAIDALVSGGAT